jgi:L-histidine Nalpha-methyltransferase
LSPTRALTQLAAPELTDEQRLMATLLRASLSASPRAIPPIFFYDTLGSALFDAICELPWYQVTRAELALLEAHGGDIGAATAPHRLVELGPGNGRKAAALARGLGQPALDVHLVDISPSALAIAATAVSTVTGGRVSTHVATYEAGLAMLGAARFERGRTLVAFLGSNIGNFQPPEACAFLGHLRRAVRAGDVLLLGADLVKPERELLLAYDDPLGVTAAFNKNVLAHINRELDADFDLDAFVHVARWNAAASRVEMHLMSLRRQAITIAAAGFEFMLQAGETIWTESSYKYEPDGIAALVESAGFTELTQWIDPVRRFALTVFSAD